MPSEPEDPYFQHLRRMRTDGWMSTISDLGGASSKTANVTFELAGTLTHLKLQDLYEGDWLTRRIVEVPVDQSLMSGYTIQDKDEAETQELQRQFQALNIARNKEGAFQRGNYLGRLFGGAVILMGFKSSGELTEPAPPVDSKPELEFLEVFHRHQLEVKARYNQDEDPDQLAKLGLPKLYRVIEGPFVNNIIHETRLIRTTGLGGVGNNDGVSNTRSTTTLEPEWGISVLQPIYCALSRYGMSWEAVSHMLQEASISVMAMHGLIKMLGSEDQSLINDRAEVINNSRSVAKTVFLDAKYGESFTRVPVSFADIPDLLAQVMQDIAGAAGMPAMILFGTTPSGLNTTGEGDLQAFYNTLNAERTIKLQPQLELLLSYVAGEEIRIQFLPLWEPTEKEKADTRLVELQGDQILFNMGAVEGNEVALARKVGKTPEEFVEESDLQAREGISLTEEPIDLPDDPDPGEVEDLAKTSAAIEPAVAAQGSTLNGAQVTSILDVISKISEGVILEQQAIAILTGAFSLSPEAAAAMVKGTTPPPDEPTAPTPPTFAPLTLPEDNEDGQPPPTPEE